MFKGYRLRNYDFKLILMVVLLAVIGVVAIGSAEPGLQNKQMFGVIGGVILMVIVSLVSYNFVLKFYPLIYLANLALLAMVMIPGLGEDGGGAQRWLKIGGLQFQPSELAKILLILFFAQFIMKYKKQLNTFKMIAACVVLFGIPWFLVYDQPDLSTSMVLIVIFCVVMFVGGISYKLILGVILVIVPAVAILFTLAMQPGEQFLKDYQKNRILAFINPEEYETKEAYQQINSVTAIASGMLEGKGYKNNEITSVKNGNFISEAQTDFIFAVIGEEFGFRGSVLVITLLIFIAMECIIVAGKAKDLAGAIIASGVGMVVAFQGFFNIGVATFMLPNTGLPLPFVSYGLTSLWSYFIGIGFVLNVRLQAKKK